ncbi:MAG: DUF4199 domain-containing protein [Bacteroidales bacterium]|nr:DUF4199 domain-containing protein [Bacteroidales bacterium]
MDKRKITAESAMRDGTILGCLWTVTFALSIVMLKMLVNGQGLLMSFAVLAMTLMSPFVAYKLAAKHRDNERDGAMTFGEAWTYIAIMYLCAILLSAIAQYVYYAYIDPSSFSDLSAQFAAFAVSNGMDETSIRMFTDAFDKMGQQSTGEMLLSIITGHLSRDLIIATILALIVKKNP